MNHFAYGFQDELEKLASKSEFGKTTASALAFMLPGAAAGGALGAGIGALRGKKGEKGKTTIRDMLIGAFLGGAASSSLMGLMGAGMFKRLEETMVPGAVVGGISGAGVGAAASDEGKRLSGAIKGGLVGTGLGTGLGYLYRGSGRGWGLGPVGDVLSLPLDLMI